MHEASAEGKFIYTMPCKKEENKVKSACAVYLGVNEQADYRSTTQLSLLKKLSFLVRSREMWRITRKLEQLLWARDFF